MRISRFLVSVVLIVLGASAQAGTTVENIRIWSESGKTRVVLDLSRPAAHNIFTLRGPDRAPGIAAQADLRVDLDYDGPGRRATVTALSPGGEQILARLEMGAITEPVD